MTIDIAAAERFVLANARLLDRHRLAVLLHRAPPEPVLQALRAYRNPDGGFGHALEPDVRDPASQPAATLHALDVLKGIGKLDDPMVGDAAAWVATIAHSNGGIPFNLPTAEAHPRAPWMTVPSTDEGSFLTFAIAGALWEAKSDEPWLDHGTAWCWAQLERPDELDGYAIKFALDFLDKVPDRARAEVAVESLRSRIGPDGCLPVPGGIENEQVTPLTLSERPGGRSRALFTDDQIEADLDRLQKGQQDDGGWDFDFLHWSPGQSVEWRGAVTLWALHSLAAHGRIALPQPV